jgi:hypothetical protein
MTIPPNRQIREGLGVLRINRLDGPGVDPNTTEYSVSFRGTVDPVGAILLARVEGLDALRELLQKLKVDPPASETARKALAERADHEISSVMLTPAMIRELGL